MPFDFALGLVVDAAVAHFVAAEVGEGFDGGSETEARVKVEVAIGEGLELVARFIGKDHGAGGEAPCGKVIAEDIAQDFLDGQGTGKAREREQRAVAGVVAE